MGGDDHDVAFERCPGAHGKIMTAMADATLALQPIAPGAEWSELAEASGSPFASVEWTEAWLEHAAGGCTPRLLAARARDGRLAAILPLVVVRGRYVRKCRFLGYGAANELGPICAQPDRGLGIAALRLALEETRGEWDVFVGESLPGSGWDARLGATTIRHESSPVARGPWKRWEDYLASRSRSLRKELRQKEGRLTGLGYRMVTTPEELEPGLDALFALHRARWGADASPFFSGLEAFHRAFAAIALERGWARLRLLELDGRPVAVNYSLRFGDSEWSYQHGRDPSLDDASVGLLVFAHAIREAFAEGARIFRLGPGPQAYKRRFSTDDPGIETVGLGRGLRGRASLLAVRRRGG
jgi:CelD/BcsL family acetyltransferase involved in cellulose biosynthesis